MIVAAIFIAVVLWLLLRRRAIAPGNPQEADRALVVLRERFARGEIGVEEYEEHRRLLESR